MAWDDHNSTLLTFNGELEIISNSEAQIKCSNTITISTFPRMNKSLLNAIQKVMKNNYLWWEKKATPVSQTVSVRSWQNSDSEARFCASPEGGTSLSQSRTYVPVGLVREKASLSLQLLPPSPPKPVFPRGGGGAGALSEEGLNHSEYA